MGHIATAGPAVKRRLAEWLTARDGLLYLRLADILFGNLYQTLPEGLYDARSDATLNSGPVVQGDEIDEIIASLLRAIRDVTTREAANV